jgi:serine/threonine protein kinase
MGQLYPATDIKLQRRVTTKILPPSLAADHDRPARFQREAEVLASLNHPNIADIVLSISGGTYSGDPFGISVAGKGGSLCAVSHPRRWACWRAAWQALAWRFSPKGR